MRISADGGTVIDFGSMSPMHLTAKKYTADCSFGGRITGRLMLPKSVPTGSAFALSAAPGGALDDKSLIVTVQVTSPISPRVGPDVTQRHGEGHGLAVLVHADAPGTEGSWTCNGSTLINRGPASLPSYGSWTWTRTS
jgi:hypothetical protein